MSMASGVGWQQRGHEYGVGLVGAVFVRAEASRVVSSAEVLLDTKINCLNILVWLRDCKVLGGMSCATNRSIIARSCLRLGGQEGSGPVSRSSVWVRSCHVYVICQISEKSVVCPVEPT